MRTMIALAAFALLAAAPAPLGRRLSRLNKRAASFGTAARARFAARAPEMWPASLSWAAAAPSIEVRTSDELAVALYRTDAAPGTIIWVHGGTYVSPPDPYWYGKGSSFRCRLRGASDKPIIVRAWPGEYPVLDGSIQAAPSSNVWFWGLEIMYSGASRRHEKTTDPSPRVCGLNLLYNDAENQSGRGKRAINCVIHDTGHPGIGIWNQGDGAGAFGCVVYHNGLWDVDTNGVRGSGIYCHNDQGSSVLADNIFWQNLTQAIHCYSAGGGAVNGWAIRGNVCIDNPGGGVFVGDQKAPITSVTVTNNYCFRDGIAVGYVQNPVLKAVVVDNVIYQGGLSAARVGVLEATGNRVASSAQELVAFTAAIGTDPLSWTGTGPTPWKMGGNRYYTDYRMDSPAHTNQFIGPPKELYYYRDWQRIVTCDATSTYTRHMPTGVWTYVRPNAYEPGRANVVVYNWDRRAAVTVDLSGVLKPGWKYEVRDVQNWHKPVRSGVYDGKPVSLPMNLTAIEAPIGTLRDLAPSMAAGHTDNTFAAFVVLPLR